MTASGLRPRLRHLALWLALALPALVSQAQVADLCGNLANNYGPWDYRDWKDLPYTDPVTKQDTPLALVDGAHFIPSCEQLIKCKRSTIGGDIDYTLRAFPNHHRALIAMLRYSQRLKMEQPPDARFTMECYFKRALRFRADDAIARMIYVNYLKDGNRAEDARVQLRETERVVQEKIAEDAGKANPFTLYNIGLLAMELGELDMAERNARQSYALGMGRTELRDKLRAAGREIEPAAAAASASPAASAASRP